MADIFISYSRSDQPTARRFAEALEREGFSVWWDQTINPGDAYDHVTEKALREAKAVAVLWSKTSVDSRWVRAEATLANRNKTLLPVMIEPCERPIMFELTHTVDLSHWKGDPKDQKWQTYVAGVRRFVQKDAPAGIPPVSATPTVARAKRFSPIAITIAVAALVVAGVALWAINRSPGSAAKPAVAVAGTSAATKVVTLAVLPFADISPGKDQGYFSEGLSAEILNQVTNIEGLRVTAQMSSFSFKGKNEDTRVIGEKLGVANLLDGSVRKDGTNLRITTQLINAGDGTNIWSHTYDRELSKVFELQEEIAGDVAKALRIKLDVGETSRAKGGTTNIEAYDKYLRGNAAVGLGAFAEALKYYREATALDPNYLFAWVSAFGAVGFTGLSNEELPKERAKILSRIEAIAPGSWQVLYLRASSLQFSQKWYEQQLAFEAAKEGSRIGRAYISSDDAHRRRKLGDMSGAQELWQPLVEANPTVFYISQWLQVHLFALGRSAEGLAELDRYKTLASYPGARDLDLLMELRFRKNANPAKVWTQYSDFVKHDPLVQSLYERRNDPKAARALLQKEFDESKGQPIPQQKVGAQRIAFWADYFGDKDLALAAIRRGIIDEGSTFQRPYLWIPYATDLRTDPRFKEIVRGAGFVDYWRKSGHWGDFCKPVGTDDFECH
jgi:TolB-like protein